MGSDLVLSNSLLCNKLIGGNFSENELPFDTGVTLGEFNLIPGIRSFEFVECWLKISKAPAAFKTASLFKFMPC